MKKAFTLSEVLITLAIIGIVAALTLPVIHSKYEIALSKNKFKKDMAVLNQMGQMSRLKFGYDFSTLQMSKYNTTCGSETSSDFTICGLVNDSLKGAKYLGLDNEISINAKIKRGVVKCQSICYATNNFRYYIWQLADGSLIGFNSMMGYRDVNSNRNCTLDEGQVADNDWVSNHWWCIGYIDNNGVDLPNQEVLCANKNDTKLGSTNPCEGKQDLNHVTDIYPFVIHDDVVEPATNASAYLFRN